MGSLMAQIDLVVFCKYIFPTSNDINLDVTVCSLLGGGVFHCPSSLSCLTLIRI